MERFINNQQKTLFIINSKYHELIYQDLLRRVPFLNNTSLKDIQHFTREILEHNNLISNHDSQIIKKLKLHLHLQNTKHDLACNINYLNELIKLENEFNNSNVTMIDEYQNLLHNQTYDFSHLTSPYDQIVILDKQDFFPVHHEIIQHLDNVIDYSFDKKTTAQVWEHDNYTNMIDGIIQSIVDQQHFTNTLIMVDNASIKELLITNLNKLGLAYTNLIEHSLVENDYLQSFFNYLNGELKPYDLVNIAALFKIKLDTKTTQQLAFQHSTPHNSDIDQLCKKIDLIRQLDYQDYLQALYNLLTEIDLHEINRINELFSELYLLDKNIDKKVLNKLLLKELTLKDDVIINNDIVLANSDFNALPFEQAYIIDASFPNLKAVKTSTLLSTKERQAISDKLITNLYLNNQFNTKLDQISNVASNIQYHYSLVDFSNKPLSLKPFISDQNLPTNTPSQYFHYTTKENIPTEEYPTNIKVNAQQVINSLINQDKLNLSASALDTFNSCQYQYYIKYVVKPKQLKKFDSLFAGKLLHYILEDLNNILIQNNQDYDFLTNTLINETIEAHFQKIHKTLSEELFIQDSLMALLKIQVTKMVARHIHNMQVFQHYSAYQIKAGEPRLTYDYPNPYLDNVTIMGKIDALFQHDDFYYVLDYKSSYKEFKIKQFLDGNANQLIMYLYLLYQKAYQFSGAFFISLSNHYRDHIAYGDDNFIDPKEQLAGILLNDDLIAFDKQYEESPSGFITSLKNDNKKDEFTNNKVNDLGNVLALFKQLETSFNTMLEQISQGSFKVNPLDAKVCKYCDYASLCHEKIFEEEDQSDE